MIVAAALLLRAASAFFLFNAENPLFDPELIRDGDLFENLEQAREILKNRGVPEGPFIHGPLYVYQTALVLAVSGGRVWAAYVFQMLLGAGAAALIYFTGRKLVSERAGFIAGLLAALYAPGAYYETILTGDSTIYFFVALLLWVCARYERGEESRVWAGPAAVGALLGALTLLRGNLALVGIGLIAWMAVMRTARTPQQRLIGIFIMTGATLAALAPASLWNSRAAGAPRFVVGEAGIIWQFSWSVYSPGYFFYPPGFPNAALVSPFSFDVWRLAAAKLIQLYSWFEFPDLTNFHLYSRLAPPLAWNPVRFSVIAPLGLAGAILGARRARERSLLYSALGAMTISAILFYISGRYRLALAPPLLLFAGFACDEALRAVRPFAPLRLAAIAGLAGALAIPMNLIDPSRMPSIWHSDIIFRNHYSRLSREAAAKSDAKALAHAAERLLWLEHLDYKLEGHSYLRAAADASGDREAYQLHDGALKEMMAAMREPRPQDSAGNVLFPPAH